MRKKRVAKATRDGTAIAVKCPDCMAELVSRNKKLSNFAALTMNLGCISGKEYPPKHLSTLNPNRDPKEP